MEQFTQPVEGQNDGQETATPDAERRHYLPGDA